MPFRVLFSGGGIRAIEADTLPEFMLMLGEFRREREARFGWLEAYVSEVRREFGVPRRSL